MENLHFYKYEGTGNDFILIDNTSNFFPKDNHTLISRLCDRHFGIGSDGLILIEKDLQHDFKMVFFNPDASQSMCGNGARCAVKFAYKLGIIGASTTFSAVDGEHQAVITENGIIKLKMSNVTQIEKHRKYAILDTGSPHHVQISKNIDTIDVKKEGSKIRYKHSTQGINVNFVEQLSDNSFKARTYERGVEDETYSCGTGATAIALAMYKMGKTSENIITIETRGGTLQVSFEVKKKFLGLKKEYENIWLSGTSNLIFEGNILCEF